MLAALHSQIQSMRIAHSLEGLKHGYGNVAAATGADFITQHLAGATAHNEYLSLTWLGHADELLRGSGKLVYNCSYFHSHYLLLFF